MPRGGSGIRSVRCQSQGWLAAAAQTNRSSFLSGLIQSRQRQTNVPLDKFETLQDLGTVD